MIVLGIMSGTSLDGMDLALVEFPDGRPQDYRFLHTRTYPYPDEWTDRLHRAYEATAAEISRLDAEYGYYIGDTVLHFLDETGAPRPRIIASHGQTVFHEPARRYTLQIGSGAHIAARTGFTVVCDFRRQDVALGGQGAPLVPMGDRMLFGQYRYCLNIGGFANISYEQQGRRLAFDTGPANMVLNLLARRAGKKYDDEGRMARSGNIIPQLLERLNNLPYYTRHDTPKSLGREFVESDILPLIDRYRPTVPDALATFTEHIAIQIGRVANRPGEMLVTGGGAYNDFLIERIAAHSRAVPVLPSPQLIDFKEALIFALLGYLRILNRPNILASVTGAPFDHSSGVVFWGER